MPEEEDHYREIGMDHPEMLEPSSPTPDPMAEILARLKALENENAVLKATISDVAAQGVQHLMTNDPKINAGIRADVARSVTIATRPVRENPEQYAHIINPNDVSQRGGN